MLLPNRAVHFRHFLPSGCCTKEFCSFSIFQEASGNGMRKVWAPRVGIMCMADSALALHRAQCPQQKTPVGKSLGEDGDFLCLIQEKPCLGWPEPVCPSGSCSEA